MWICVYKILNGSNWCDTTTKKKLLHLTFSWTETSFFKHSIYVTLFISFENGKLNLNRPSKKIDSKKCVVSTKHVNK